MLTDRIKSLSKKLDGGTGILGLSNLKWDTIKKNVMKLEENLNSIEVEFEGEDQIKILEFIQKQEQADNGGP